MKVIEILNFNRELLKRLQAAGIRLEELYIPVVIPRILCIFAPTEPAKPLDTSC